MGNANSHHNQRHHARVHDSLPPHAHHHQVYQKKHEEAWTSLPYPKPPQQHKLIVPDRDALQRLRPTDNGEIIHSGGTISGKKQLLTRSNSIHSQTCRQQTRAHHNRHNYYNRNNAANLQKMKHYGSEPNLQKPHMNDENFERQKSRKKYKAPPPPPMNDHYEDRCDSKRTNSSDDSPMNEFNSPIRRARLFKTRNETKMASSPVHSNKYNNSNTPNIKHISKSAENLAEIDKSPSINFKEELLEKITHLAMNRSKNKLKTLDHSVTRRDLKLNKFKDIKDSSNKTRDQNNNNKQAVNTFFFGMEKQVEMQQIVLDPTPADSDISADESESETVANNISLQLRPILPRKQFDLPVFSPVTAWKQLTVGDANANDADTIVSVDESTVLMESKIEKLAREPASYQVLIDPNSSPDKSGDSGISGDERPDVIMSVQRRMSWTPQQDLGDDSSFEEGSMHELSNKFSRIKPHVFSLSLPRENHLAAYISEKPALEPYSSLQRIKTSMSGLLHINSNNSLTHKEPEIDSEEENWFLSKSAPNSLKNRFNSDRNINPTNTGRIIYLPEFNGSIKRNKHLSKSHDNLTSSVNQIESLQDTPPPVKTFASTNITQNKKPRKFTFQSTVRQIERKRVAEKLSKEAECHENQRRRELEAMQRVEEEFQRKRAKEKASLRQQLRLYNHNSNDNTNDDSACSSLPSWIAA